MAEKFDISEIGSPGKTLKRRMAEADDAPEDKKPVKKEEKPAKDRTMSQADFTAPPGKRSGIIRSILGD
jgi:Ni,Fe-hydrogenase III component G